MKFNMDDSRNRSENDPESRHKRHSVEHNGDSTPRKRAKSNDDNADGKSMKVKFLIHKSFIGAVMGKGGGRIQDVRNRTCVEVRISKANEVYPGTDNRIVQLCGEGRKLKEAFALFINPIEREHFDLDLVIPEGVAGAVIGKKGCNISKYGKVPDSKVNIQPTDEAQVPGERIIFISGLKPGINEVFSLILEVLVDYHPKSINFPDDNFTSPVRSDNRSDNRHDNRSDNRPDNRSDNRRSNNLVSAQSLGVAISPEESYLDTKIPRDIQTLLLDSGVDKKASGDIGMAFQVLKYYGLIGHRKRRGASLAQLVDIIEEDDRIYGNYGDVRADAPRNSIYESPKKASSHFNDKLSVPSRPLDDNMEKRFKVDTISLEDLLRYDSLALQDIKRYTGVELKVDQCGFGQSEIIILGKDRKNIEQAHYFFQDKLTQIARRPEPDNQKTILL